MKLSVSINLEPLREYVGSAIDSYFASKVPPQVVLQRAKSDLVRTDPNHPALVEEASLRGITVSQLRDMILTAADAADELLINTELERQKAKALVRSATSEQVLKSLLTTYSGS